MPTASASRPAQSPLHAQTALEFSEPDEPQPDVRERSGARPAINPFAPPGGLALDGAE